MEHYLDNPAHTDTSEDGFVTLYGHPAPPPWEGMLQDFRELLELVWAVLVEVTYKWEPFNGATLGEITRGVNYRQHYARYGVAEIIDMVKILVVEGFARKNGDRYLLIDKRIYGKKYMSNGHGKAFTKEVRAEEFYGDD